MARVDLDGKPIKALTICMIGAGGFIGSHLCEKLMNETPHTVLALDVYNDKIKHLLEPDSLPWSGRITFHRLNIKHDSRLEGLIKIADLVFSFQSFFLFLSFLFLFFLLSPFLIVFLFFLDDKSGCYLHSCGLQYTPSRYYLQQFHRRAPCGT